MQTNHAISRSKLCMFYNSKQNTKIEISNFLFNRKQMVFLQNCLHFQFVLLKIADDTKMIGYTKANEELSRRCKFNEI